MKELERIKEPKWTREDSILAQSEGWDLFYSEGSLDGLWQVQAIDELGILPNDQSAWQVVMSGTKSHHHKALSILKKENKPEYRRIMLSRTN